MSDTSSPKPSTASPAEHPYRGLMAQELGPIETRQTKKLRHYESRWVWPPSFQDTQAWHRLRHSLKRHGMREPLIILADGQVIDGGHRLDLARELGLDHVPVRVAALPLPLSDEDRLRVEVFAVRNAIGRRQLDPLAVDVLLMELFRGRAEIEARRAASLRNLKKGTKAGSKDRTDPTIAEEAKKAGVSPRHAKRLSRIAREGSPELQAAVQSGELSVREADYTLRARPPLPAERFPETHRELEQAVAGFLKSVDSACAGSDTWPDEGQMALVRALDEIGRDLRETLELIAQQRKVSPHGQSKEDSDP